ncbi:hypothetical protein [Blastococcus sp. SYSU DS1024]
MPQYRLILTPPETVIDEFESPDDQQAVGVGMAKATTHRRSNSVSRGRDFQLQRRDGDWELVLGWTGLTGG